MTSQAFNKKITFFLPRLHNNIRPLIDTLIELNFEVTVLALREGRVENHSGIKYIKLRKSSIFTKKYFDAKRIKKIEFPSLSQVYKLLKNQKPDYMIIRNDFTLAYLPVLILSMFRRSKILLYNQYPKNNPPFLQFVYNLFFYKLLHIKTITPVLNKLPVIREKSYSESLEQYRLRLFTSLKHDKSKSGTVWVPFILRNKPVSFIADNDNIIKIVTVGKIQKRKNLDQIIWLLESYAKSRDLPIELTIIGESVDLEENFLSYLQKLKHIVSKSVQIRILVNLNHEEVCKIYDRSNIFMLLSEKEIASVSQVEAFQSGCSIIIFFENGNLDFLPLDPLLKIIYNFHDTDKSLDIILKNPNSRSRVLSYSSIYEELCCGVNGVNRILNLF